MTHRFVAVDVGTGDAFFLQRNDFSALVDGGQATGFPRRLKRATGVDAVNVIVCTHNDRDHANGILAFLEEGCDADECWLPATWMEATHRLCTASDEEIISLFDAKEEVLPEEALREENAEISVDDVAEQLTKVEVEPTWLLQTVYSINSWLVIPPGILIPHGAALSKSTVPPWIADAVRILKIALAAHRLQIPIKWFDTERTAPAQAPSRLSVVNAAPVKSIRRARLSLKGVIKLTTANKNSLVLYSRPDDVAAGVLFCSDSGFTNLASPPTDVGMIVTAPHHGSCDPENVAVYRMLDEAGVAKSPHSWLWVRSNRDCSERPCDEYIARQKRCCTRCRGQTGKKPFQNVIALGSGGTWASNSRPCSCA